MLNKLNLVILPATIFLLAANTPVQAGLHDWGIKGVSDTTLVEKVLQFTDNPAFTNTYISSYSDPWSPSGEWIVYTATINEDRPLCKIRMDGTDFTMLTGNSLGDTNSTFDINARFATDGSIYFERYQVTDGKRQIWRMDGDGTNEKNLSAVDVGDSVRYVQPSPDVNWIAYHDSFNNVLKVARADGTSPITVSGTENIWEPQHNWSPDSEWLVYKGNEAGNDWIYKVKRDGTSRTVLTRPPFISAPHTHKWPAWSPDGKKIAYIWMVHLVTHYSYNLRINNADGSGEQSLDSATTSIAGWQQIKGPLSWSPDGNWIGYQKNFDNSTVSYKGLFIARADSASPPTQLTIDYDDYHPSWSPDGSRILFKDDYHSSTHPSRDGNLHIDLLMLKLIGKYKNFPWILFHPITKTADN